MFDPFGYGGAVNTVSLPSMPGLCKADDLLPFYWTAADLAAGKGTGPVRRARVGPRPQRAGSGNNFVTALTEVKRAAAATGHTCPSTVSLAAKSISTRAPLGSKKNNCQRPAAWPGCGNRRRSYLMPRAFSLAR